jgi:hypothetical protein
MTAVHVTKFKGSQGSWEAEVTYSDGSKEVLACVHKHYFKRDALGFYYHDPHLAIPEHVRSTKFTKQIELIRSKGRVILTTDDVNESKMLDPGFFKRTGYVAVYPISDFVIDDEGMHFRFGNPIRPR